MSFAEEVYVFYGRSVCLLRKKCMSFAEEVYASNDTKKR